MKSSAVAFSVVVTFTVMVTTAQSQEFSVLFEKDIPAMALKIPETMKNFNDRLRSVVKLDPELIYFELEYLSARYPEKATGLQDVFRMRQKTTSVKRQARNEWITRQLEIVKNKYKDKRHIKVASRALKSYVQSVKKDRRSETDFVVDENKIDYVVYKYYKRSPEIQFDQNTKYKPLRVRVESERRNELSERAKTANSDSESRLITEVLDSWVLFSQTSSPEDGVMEMSAALIEGILILSEETFDPPHFSLFIKTRSGFGMPTRGSYFFRASVFPDPGNASRSRNVKFDYKSGIKLVTIGGSYTYFFTRYFGRFTYIRAVASYSLSISKESLREKEGPREIITIDGTFRRVEDLTWLRDPVIDVKSIKMYQAGLLTPLLLLPKVTFEAGLMIHHVNLKSTNDYRFDYRVVEYEGTTVLRAGVNQLTRVEKKNESYYVISPGFRLNYRITRRIELLGDASFFYSSLGLGVVF